MTSQAPANTTTIPKTSSARLLAPLLYPFRQQRLAIHFIIGLQALILLPLYYALSFICASWLASSSVSPLIMVMVPITMMVRTLLQLMKERLSTTLSLRVRQHLRQQLQQRLQQYGPARVWYGSDGEHAMLLEQVDALDGYISRYLPQQRLAVIAPLVIALSVGYFSPLAALLLLITAPILVVFMILTGLHASKANQAHLQQLTMLGGRLLDFLQGRSTLQQLHATHIAEDVLAQSSQAYLQKTMTVLKMAFLSTAVLELFASLAVALVALYLGLGLLGELPWAQQQLVLPYQAALFILLLAPEFYLPLRQLGSDYHAKAQAMSALEQLAPLWRDDAKVALLTPPRYHHDRLPTPDTQYANVTDTGIPCIDIRQLTIPQAPQLYIPNWQLSAGEHWLITGVSGIGKSSLLQALCGFLPYQGELSFHPFASSNTDFATQAKVGTMSHGTSRENMVVNSMVGESAPYESTDCESADCDSRCSLNAVSDSAEAPPAGHQHPGHQHLGHQPRLDNGGLWFLWRQHISYLPQQVVLAYGTVRDNLAWVSGITDDTQLAQALSQVGLSDVVGLDDRLGADGISLSGGQQQRLALAQLLLQDRPIWLLDEPLVQLDDVAAQGLSTLLARLAAGRTLVVVSHQPSLLPWISHRLHLTPRTALIESSVKDTLC